MKEVVVEPGAQLSLQPHHHSAEYWIVVRSTGRMTVDEEIKTVSENQSVSVPQDSIHRLENLGRIPMHLIEVQTGSYLEQDNIVGYGDAYGRSRSVSLRKTKMTDVQRGAVRPTRQ